MTDSSALSPKGKRHSFFDPETQDYCVALFGPEDSYLSAISRDTEAHGFPSIAVSPMDGQVLRFLVLSCRAKRAVEIGTLAGYSALWIARALPPGGRLDCFEIHPDRAAVAREHLKRAAPPPEIVVHQGPALQNLSVVSGPVDFVFIDADKGNYPAYLDWAANHLRPGGIVALDNAFAWGALCDPSRLGENASDAVAIRKSLDALAHDGRFDSAMIPTNEGLAVGIRR